MKPPYENNKVYAIAAHPSGFKKAAYTAAVFAQVRFEYSGRVSDDPAEGRFFVVDVDDNGGTADCWDPGLKEGSLLVLPESHGALELTSAQVLSLWADVEEAWAAYEARIVAGRKGAQTRKDRQYAERSARLQKASQEREAKRAGTPVARLEELPGIDRVLLMKARRTRPAQVHLDLIISPDEFRDLMAFRNADPDLVEEFLQTERRPDR